jgi:hypothetical protein
MVGGCLSSADVSPFASLVVADAHCQNAKGKLQPPLQSRVGASPSALQQQNAVLSAEAALLGLIRLSEYSGLCIPRKVLQHHRYASDSSDYQVHERPDMSRSAVEATRVGG